MSDRESDDRESDDRESDDRGTVERNPVEVLADEFVERRRRGEDPDISSYEDRYPQLAAEIRALFPTVAMMERSAREQESVFQAAYGGDPDHNLPQLKTLGDYRIIREIGRGGMGVVFEAVQQSLGQHVALKVLGGGPLANERKRRRFLREAQAAGSLHHTSIVPVFGVGEQDDLVYYVMPLIDGHGLDEVLSELRDRFLPPPSGTRSHVGLAGERPTSANAPETTGSAPLSSAGEAGGRGCRVEVPEFATQAYCRWLADWGAQVADALAYAHGHAIQHRDIKPANILLGVDRTALVTDFGVARVAHDESLTRTGDVVGTERYMPPEQASGAGDARSDIYSLGLTLYESLCLQQRPRSSGTQGLRQSGGRRSPRRADMPDFVPADLAKIVVTATEEAPEHRYQSAALLAEDLRRFRAGRPILARRVATLSRLGYWSRRNPALASLSVVAVAGLLLSAIVGWFGYASTSRALAELEVAHHESEENLSLALEAFDSVLRTIVDQRDPIVVDELAEPEVTVPEVPTALDLRVARDLLRFYQRYARFHAENQTLEFEIAKAERRIGELSETLGRFSEARDAYQSAIERFELAEAAARKPSDHSGRRIADAEHAAALNGLGRVLRRERRTDESIARHRQALATLHNDQSTDARQVRFDAHVEIATALLAGKRQNGRFVRTPDDVREAETQLHAALELTEGLRSMFPKNSTYALQHARCHRLLCISMALRGSARQGNDHYLTALRELRELDAHTPRVAQNERELVLLLVSAAMFPMPRTKKAEALHEGVAIARRLYDTYPHIPEYRLLLTIALTRLGAWCKNIGDLEESESHYARAVDCIRQLHEAYPDVVSFQQTFSARLEMLAGVQQTLNRMDESAASLYQATDLLERLIRDDANPDPSVVDRLTIQYLSLAEILRSQSAAAAADELQQRASELRNRLIATTR